MTLSDHVLEDVIRLGNAAIHETVFALQHAEQGDGDDALTCIVQVQQNCETIANAIIAQMKEEGET